MPNPSNFKDKKSFMKACVPMVISEGTAKDGSQGYAICLSKWREHLKNKRAKGEILSPDEQEELKQMNMNSKELENLIKKL